MFIFKLFFKYLTTFGSYLLLMGGSIAVPEGDVTTWCRLHRYCAFDFVFHWCSNLHPDESQHSKPLDASLGVGIYNA